MIFLGLSNFWDLLYWLWPMQGRSVSTTKSEINTTKEHKFPIIQQPSLLWCYFIDLLICTIFCIMICIDMTGRNWQTWLILVYVKVLSSDFRYLWRYSLQTQQWTLVFQSDRYQSYSVLETCSSGNSIAVASMSGWIRIHCGGEEQS